MRRTYLTLGILLSLVALPALLAAQERQSAGFAVMGGRATYERYCASCHGREGHGDGNVAQYLTVTPTDLTRLKAEAGEYPAERVREYIDGRKAAAAHGSREMPVWGEVFQSSLAEPRGTDEEGEERAERIIDELVAYIELIQVAP